MAYRLAYEYNSEEINSPRIDVFLAGENIFNAGGFTLKPNFQYTNRSDLGLGLKAIEGKPGFSPAAIWPKESFHASALQGLKANNGLNEMTIGFS